MKNPRAFTEGLRQKLAQGINLDDALTELRASGASIIQCVIAVNACRRCGLKEAQKLVLFSPAWADMKEKQEKLQREEDEKARNTPVLTKVIRYAIVISLFGACIGIAVRGQYLSSYYYLHAPRQADSSLGAVFPIIIHHGGAKNSNPIQVYLTEKEWHGFSPTSDAIYAGIFTVALVAGFVLGFRWNILKPKHCHPIEN